jgi:TetR/AcrR family transcriptional regulator
MSRSVGQMNGSAANANSFILSNDNMTDVRRKRRTREDLRQQLLESALVEFAAKGFDGASTRSIAERVDAYQPQINYHFASKESLWEAAVDHLFGLLADAFGDLPLVADDEDPRGLAENFAESLRRFVRFAAEHPELNQIMVQEGTEDSDRARWMVDRHVRPWYDATTTTWTTLQRTGIAAPIQAGHVYWMIIGAASIPFVNAPEVRTLTGAEPTSPAWVERHADDLIATLLPGLANAPTPASSRRRTKP